MAQRTYLVIGSGGREHALAWKLSQGDDAPRVFVAPGNDGIAADGDIRGGCVPIVATDFAALADFAHENDVTLTVVGPEAPLCAGIVDHFEARGLPIFGPHEAAAALEGSKAFAKEIMDAAGVPTAGYRTFEALRPALEHVRTAAHPLVIKADGLASGKGVVISPDVATSVRTLEDFLGGEGAGDGRFGAASSRVIVEQFLQGTEMSFMVVTDGTHVVTLPTSQDHKRLSDGDHGPNTGGMGAFSPSPHASDALEREVLERVIRPILGELARRGIAYRGFLYAGLMLTERGLSVLEFNVRLGDPETQAIVFVLDADLGAVLERAARGELEDGRLGTAGHGCCVVMASAGYPGTPECGHPIEGLDAAAAVADTKVFHAGTRRDAQGRLVNDGGRVLGVTAKGDSPVQARTRAYEAVSKIDWRGVQYRHDIGPAG